MFERLGENAKEYMKISVLLEKELVNGNILTLKTKFIEIVRFMASSLSNLGDNFTEGLHKGAKILNHILSMGMSKRVY